MSDNNTEAVNTAEEKALTDVLRVRREKLAELQAAGKDPFQITKYDRTHSSEDVKNNFDTLENKRLIRVGFDTSSWRK